MVKTTVANRFEMTELLGSGGFGAVYRAWDRRLEREVAVKVLETSTSSAARVRREAQAAARLNHPSIVTLYEFVQHELGPGEGRAFLVSELVEGPTVRQLYDRGALSDREVASVGVAMARALEHAHSRGVVHRDVKPSNLAVNPDGEAKLMDFGVARLEGVEELTQAGDVLGTLAYMAPEQAEGVDAGLEADVYSLALTLFEGWSGENPRRRAGVAGTARVAAEPLPSLAEYRPDLPVDLVDLIDDCLEVDPDWRPSASDLASGLERWLPELDSGARPAVPRRGFGRTLVGHSRTASAAVGLVTSAMVGLVLGIGGVTDPASIAATAAAAGLVSAISPRIGFPLAGVATAAWLGLAGGLWGASAAILLVWAVPGAVVRGNGPAVLAIPLAPLAGLAGLAPLVCLVAGFGERARDRATLAAAALLAAAGVEAATGRKALFGDVPPAADDWANSVGDFLTGMAWPVVSAPTFPVALAVWLAVALGVGLLVDRQRSRSEPGPGDLEVSGVGSGGVTDAR